MGSWETRRVKGSIVLALLVALFPFRAYGAVPKGAVKLGSDLIFSTTASSRRITCGFVSRRWQPGTLVGPQKSYFYSTSAEVQKTKIAASGAHGAARSKLLAKLSSLKGKLSVGLKACKAGPRATPTPTPSNGFSFDSGGNVTSSGKALFGIPSNLEGNISQGRTLYTFYCSGCHNEHTGRTFSSYREAIALPSMGYDSTQIPDTTLAHITAYLNRFTP